MKTIISIIIVVFFAVSASAQTENTSARLITQLKNGTAPGLRFAPNAPDAAPATGNALQQKEGLITQIRKGTAPGMKFMTATAGTASIRTARTMNSTQVGTLASEQEIKKEALKTVAAPPPIPTQAEVKQENNQ